MSQTTAIPIQRPSYAPMVLALEQIVAQLPLDAIPGLIGELERLKALTWTRITGERVTTSMEDDDLLTIREVARRLKISEYRAYELARQNILKSVRLGKSVRVKPSALADYLTQQGG